MPVAVRATIALVLAAASVALAGCGGGGGGDTTASAAPRIEDGSRVFVIVLENHEFGEVIGSPDAPYFNRLAEENVLATRFYAVSHPSLPNYLAMIGGSTFGIESDCTDCKASGLELGQQLTIARVGWRAYMEGMPHSCFQGGFNGLYAKKHNPFYYFPAIASSPVLCRRVVPGEELERDLSTGSLPTFGWLTPDLCNDAHDCPFRVTDRYLSKLIPRLAPHLGPDGFIVLTFDEGVSSKGCCGADGGRIATVLLGPSVRRGVRISDPYTSYSLLATLEDTFGLPRLREARDARPMSAAFR